MDVLSNSNTSPSYILINPVAVKRAPYTVEAEAEEVEENGVKGATTTGEEVLELELELDDELEEEEEATERVRTRERSCCSSIIDFKSEEDEAGHQIYAKQMNSRETAGNIQTNQLERIEHQKMKAHLRTRSLPISHCFIIRIVGVVGYRSLVHGLHGSGSRYH